MEAGIFHVRNSAGEGLIQLKPNCHLKTVVGGDYSGFPPCCFFEFNIWYFNCHVILSPSDI